MILNLGPGADMIAGTASKHMELTANRQKTGAQGAL